MKPPSALANLHALVPVRSPAGAKTRLGLALDAEEREVIVLGMLARTLDVLLGWPHGATVHVVSDDDGLLLRVEQFWPGAQGHHEPDRGGLNAALVSARTSAVAQGAAAVLMLPADLPLLTSDALDRLVDAADAALAAGAGSPVVAIAPADARGGTNALLLAPAEIIAPCFGEASLEAHLRAAAAAGASVQLVVDPALGFDLDTPEDLERLDAAALLELQAPGERLAAAARASAPMAAPFASAESI